MIKGDENMTTWLAGALGPGAWMRAALLMGQASEAETALIAGANPGLGLDFARQYAADGWTVIATHRHDSTPDGLASLMKQHKNVSAERMDVSDTNEMHALSGNLKDVPIDVLLDNAALYAERGDWSMQNFGNLDYRLGETILRTNTLGPLFVAESFARQIGSSQQKKIVSITSTQPTATQPLAGSSAVFYRASKAGLNRAMLVVDEDVRPQGITVLLIHSGSVQKSDQESQSSPSGRRVKIDVTARKMRKTISDVTIKDSGRFLLYDGSTLPW